MGNEAKRGGNKAAIFVYGCEGLENMAFVSVALSLVTYFSGYMNFSLTKSVTTLTNFMGTTFLLTLLGGFISETYLSRFKTCLLFAFFELTTPLSVQIRGIVYSIFLLRTPTVP
uniref:Uncharacterized protein n=1 Tax=Cucumis melo TaxID=3656 RepID=A0A9I9E8N4_CUCME